MKIIEKKCPNCGASLSFNDNDKETKCNYCNREFIIEGEKEDSSKVKSEDFILHEKVIKAYGIVHYIISFIIILITIGVFFFIFRGVSSSISKDASFSISNVDEKTFEMIHNSSLNELKNMGSFYSMIYKEVDYEYIGSYLYKSTFNNTLVDVYKVKYVKNEDKSYDTYVSVKYSNIKYENNKVTLKYDGFISTNKVMLENDIFSSVDGYLSLEELYMKEISNDAKGKIEGVGGVYLEH